MSLAGTLIAEIVGPAGAGKSTLAVCLNQLHMGVRAGITIWGLPPTSILVGAISSLRALFVLFLDRRMMRFSDLKQVIRLNAFYRYLKHLSEQAGTSGVNMLFLDEGVVFALSKLRADNHRRSIRKSRRLIEWELETIRRWAAILDTIVWLDGPDELLTERIRTRDKQHRMKTGSDVEIADFLGRYRYSYKSVITDLSAASDIKIMKFRTESTSPQSIASEISQSLKGAFS